MNITKSIAENVASQLTAKIKLKIDDERKILTEKVDFMAKKRVPKEIMNWFNTKNKKWLNIRGYIQFASASKHYNIEIKAIPYPYDNGYVVITEEEMTELYAQDHKIQFLEEQKRTIENQLVAQLIKMRTYKRIEKDFPEAFELLPNAEVSELPAINVKDILMQIEEI